ncbi:MAG: tRNA pseudouridine(38-40) synthase TruA [Limnochordia bacterium]|nr:tRNA pseudouridine(38-40) synthase TruA [Limnochordia bacterium]
MHTYCLIVQYDGTDYAGFQVQPGQRTIQGELEAALHRLGPSFIRIAGAGRTDAGVHSEGQTVSFKDDKLTVPIERLPHALNALLPCDIRVIGSRLEHGDFHARISARAKTYRYQIYESEFPNVFYQRYAYWIRRPLNWDRISECGKLFLGQLDFAAFAASGSSAKTTVRTMHEVLVDAGSPVKTIRFTANGFLYNMVRNVVGTMVDVGLGKLSLQEVQAILESGDRRRASATIAPQGLYLERVNYS